MECTIINNHTGKIISNNFNIKPKELESNSLNVTANIMGVYKIQHIPTGKIYIGSSCDILSRWKDHKRKLEQNRHHSYKLQDVWNSEPVKSNFSFEVIEVVDSRKDLFEKEQYWIDFYDSSSKDNFNVMELAGESPKMSSQQLFYDFQKEVMGNFIFFMYNNLEKLEEVFGDADLVKYIYIATYVKHDGYLMYDNNIYIDKKGLQKILLNTKSVFLKFFNNAINSKLLIEVDGKFKIDTNIFCKSSIKNVGKSKHIKLYINAIRKLYYQYNKNVRKLSYIFKLMPYVNKNYNVLCRNILETNKAEINRLTVGDIMEILQYDKTHISRFKKDFYGIKFDDNVLSKTVQDKAEHLIYINPLITYNICNIENFKQIQEKFE